MRGCLVNGGEAGGHKSKEEKVVALGLGLGSLEALKPGLRLLLSGGGCIIR